MSELDGCHGADGHEMGHPLPPEPDVGDGLGAGAGAVLCVATGFGATGLGAAGAVLAGAAAGAGAWTTGADTWLVAVRVDVAARLW